MMDQLRSFTKHVGNIEIVDETEISLELKKFDQKLYEKTSLKSETN